MNLCLKVFILPLPPLEGGQVSEQVFSLINFISFPERKHYFEVSAQLGFTTSTHLPGVRA